MFPDLTPRSDLVFLNRPQRWGASQSVGFIDLPFTTEITIDAQTGNNFRLVLTGNATLRIVNLAPGQELTILLVQDSTGSHTVTWSDGFLFANSPPAPTLTATADRADLLGFVAIPSSSGVQALFCGPIQDIPV